MIGKTELLEAATVQSIGRPHVVEKDYALGWILAGIYAQVELKDSWVFKGGTCLKKCFFETYRFSEDLDFTLIDENHIDKSFLKQIFGEISDWVYDACGLELPTELQDFDVYQNPRGNLSCQGKLSYRGPLAPRSGGLPRIKLDLTADERLVLAPVRQPVFHPYSDRPIDGIDALAYTYEEAFGEKVRALGERTRPRDLYDVINLFRNESARPTASVLLDVLRQKCEFKGIEVPSMRALETHRTELEGSWSSMLSHQLPSMPPLEGFWSELPLFFNWLMSGVAPARPDAFAMASGETVIRERALALPISLSSKSYIEIIRFAAANRLCVDLDYITLNGQRGTRRIEPYSLRRTAKGDVVLHAFRSDDNAHRSYRVERIVGARATNQTFVPKYQVELSPNKPVSIEPTFLLTANMGSGDVRRRPARAQKKRTSSTSGARNSGPIFVIECTSCGKKFQRKKYSTTLNAHKNKNGYPCVGRIGTLVDTKF